jgi:hypothetical protein
MMESRMTLVASVDHSPTMRAVDHSPTMRAVDYSPTMLSCPDEAGSEAK